MIGINIMIIIFSKSLSKIAKKVIHVYFVAFNILEYRKFPLPKLDFLEARYKAISWL